MDSPVISVIMPVYNAEKYVYQAIDSILKQTYADFEFLIFNDGSTDASREIICSFNDPRIRLMDSPVNTGYVKHLNEGLKQAKGHYIARMDADDIADTSRFLKQVQFLELHHDVVACGSWIEFFGSQEGVLQYPVEHVDILTQLLLFGNAMAHPAVMMRKSVLDENHFTYDASLEPAEDYALWYHLSKTGKLHNLPEVLLKYRMHDQNESVVKREKQNLAVSRIRQTILSEQQLSFEDLMMCFLNNQIHDGLSAQQLINIRTVTLQLLSKNDYNKQTIETVLSNRYVAWCKAANQSGWQKMMLYIRFPKHFFSFRICLSLLWNK